MKLTATLVLLCLAAPAAAQTAFFDDPTDVIQVDGQTVLGTAATYEAVVLFPGGVGSTGRLFNEWTFFQEDKILTAGPTHVSGGNYPAGSALAVSVVLAPDVWHHVAFVYDGAEERLYVDGILLASRPMSITVGNGPGLAHIGAIFRDGTLNAGFVGYLETVRVSEVARYSASTFTPPLGDLESDAHTLLLLNFDEPAGSPTVQDESPLGRVGTLATGFDGATAPLLGGTPQMTDCPLAPVTMDLWDVARETVITASSGFKSGSDEEGENIFGGDFPTPEPGYAFFRDDRDDGFEHFVEWETAADVTPRSFVLRAGHDAGLLRRSFRQFRLFGYDAETEAFELLYEFEPPLPYGGGAEQNQLLFCANLPETTARRFRAEFVQHGGGSFSGPRVIELDAFSTPLGFPVSAEGELGSPEAGALHAAYPNPFAHRTTLAFDLPAPAPVRLAVYDVLGRRVAVLADEHRAAGRHEVVFDGTELPGGVYLVRIEAGAFAATRRVVLVR